MLWLIKAVLAAKWEPTQYESADNQLHVWNDFIVQIKPLTLLYHEKIWGFYVFVKEALLIPQLFTDYCRNVILLPEGSRNLWEIHPTKQLNQNNCCLLRENNSDISLYLHCLASWISVGGILHRRCSLCKMGFIMRTDNPFANTFLDIFAVFCSQHVDISSMYIYTMAAKFADLVMLPIICHNNSSSCKRLHQNTHLTSQHCSIENTGFVWISSLFAWIL